MKKVILLSAVLGLGALGMACGEAANNTPVKPANVAPAVVNAANVAANTAQVAANQMANVANSIKSGTNMAPAGNMSKSNTAAPANTAKKP